VYYDYVVYKAGEEQKQFWKFLQLPVLTITALLSRSQLAAPSTLTFYFLAVVAEVVDLMMWTVGRSVVYLREQLSSESQGSCRCCG
jgi:hypothetical protein